MPVKILLALFVSIDQCLEMVLLGGGAWLGRAPRAHHWAEDCSVEWSPARLPGELPAAGHGRDAVDLRDGHEVMSPPWEPWEHAPMAGIKCAHVLRTEETAKCAQDRVPMVSLHARRVF